MTAAMDGVAFVSGASRGAGAAIARAFFDKLDLVLADAGVGADVVLFTVTRPPRLRMMTVSFHPMSEVSWG